MAHSSGRVGTNEVKERFDSPDFRDSQGAYAYHVEQESGAYFLEFTQQRANSTLGPVIQGRRKLDYFVGSGAAARSYVMSVDGFLYLAPAAYYTNSASWKPAPGYASAEFPYLTRPVLPGCLECHSSGVQRIPDTQNEYASPPFREGGVACERCHGPGSEHIALGTPMINPAKLAAPERDSICEQCHLSGEIRVPKPGKDDLSFRAGDRLANISAVFVREGSGSDVRVTSHAENLAASACKRASGDKLWCGTCHDPHSVPSAAEKAAYFRAKCLNCHAVSDCQATQASRQANADNCTACHMPRNPPSDIEHVVFTDHSIPRRPRPDGGIAGASPRTDADLVQFGGGETNARDLGLAYAMVGLREANDTYLERAFHLLQEAVHDPADADSLALAYLAQFYRDRKDDAHALPLYEEAWRKDRTQSAVAAAIGAYWMQLGNQRAAAGAGCQPLTGPQSPAAPPCVVRGISEVDQAIVFWNRALAISPALLLVRVNLAGALSRKGQPEEAKEILRKALEFDPTFQPARDLLNRVTK